MTASFLDVLDSVAADRVALSDASEAITYGTLRDRARRGASVISKTFADREFVIIKARPSVDFVTTLLGVMYAGKTPVPVDPELPPAGLEFIRAKTGAGEILDPLDATALAAAGLTDARAVERPALIMFTSGTSGFPKGVIVSHRNLLASCEAMADYLGYREHPSAAVVLPLHYSYALLSQVCCQLTVGGRVHVFADMRNPLKVSRAMNDLRLETFCGVPSTYHALHTFHTLSPITMPHVRILCSAGAAMDVAQLQRVKTIFPNALFFNNYGMTEAAPRTAPSGKSGEFAQTTLGVDLGKPLKEARDEAVERFELLYLETALRRAGGNVTRAAELAGVSRRFLQRTIARLGIRGAATMDDVADDEPESS
jgi:long-chain acyl-CoA synthetase